MLRSLSQEITENPGMETSQDILLLHSFICCFSTRCKLMSSGKRKAPLRKRLPIRLACGQVCKALSWLMIDVGGLRSLWVVPPLDKMALCGISRQSKPASSTPPWFLLQFLPSGSCIEFLPRLPFTADYNCKLKSTLSSLGYFWSWCLHYSSRKQMSIFLVVSLAFNGWGISTAQQMSTDFDSKVIYYRWITIK